MMCQGCGENKSGWCAEVRTFCATARQRCSRVVKKSYKVLHLETGEIYGSAAEAAEALQLDKKSVNKACSGDRMSHKGQHFKYV
jgi:hypothetical protein